MRHDFLLGGFHRFLARGFLRDRVSSPQILLDDAEHFLFQRVGVGQLEVARFLRRLFRKLDDGVDHRLEMPMSEHHRAQHDFFAQLLGFRFHHEHGVGGAGDDEIELALHHLVELRIEHVFIVDEADAGGADRPHEGRARQRERGRCRHHGDDIGIVLKIVRQRGDDHLRIAAIALGEQRTDRAVDQTGNQGFLFGRPAFALEIAAGNTAGGVEFFLVIDGERKEIDAFLGLLRRNDGGEHFGLAVSGEHGAVSKAGDLSGLEG